MIAIAPGSVQCEHQDTMAELAASKYTVEEALEHIGFGRTQVIMFLFVGTAWAGDGMEMMLLSYLGPEVRHDTPCREQLGPLRDFKDLNRPHEFVGRCSAAEMQVGPVPRTRELDHQCGVHRDDAWLVQLGSYLRQVRSEDRIFRPSRVHSCIRHSECHSSLIRRAAPPAFHPPPPALL